jgi:hypothetical protein
MDILYYSNYCKHSQRIVQTLVKNNLGDKLSFICIDKRSPDPKNGQMYIQLENGGKVIFPPNVHSVPTLLLVKDKYRAILGDEILQHFHKDMKQSHLNAQPMGEPSGFHISSFSGGNSITSEKFTNYNLTPDDLSAKGNGASRPLYNYVSVKNDTLFINTPPDDYKPDKVSSNVTVDTLQQKRIDEIVMQGGRAQPNLAI